MLTQDRTDVAKKFTLGLADLAVSRDPNLTLCTAPLGACLAVAIYDPVAKVGGLLHSLLPDSTIDPQRAAARPAMFLDTGLAELLRRATEMQATPANLVVYVAGGGQIIDESTYFNIGKRNYAVLADLLARRSLSIGAEDVGGLANRTIELSIETGEVRLRFSGNVRMKILCKQ